MSMRHPYYEPRPYRLVDNRPKPQPARPVYTPFPREKAILDQWEQQVVKPRPGRP